MSTSTVLHSISNIIIVINVFLAVNVFVGNNEYSDLIYVTAICLNWLWSSRVEKRLAKALASEKKALASEKKAIEFEALKECVKLYEEAEKAAKDHQESQKTFAKTKKISECAILRKERMQACKLADELYRKTKLLTEANDVCSAKLNDALSTIELVSKIVTDISGDVNDETEEYLEQIRAVLDLEMVEEDEDDIHQDLTWNPEDN